MRVLLRLGTPYGGAPTTKKVGGYTVIIVGEAKREDWPPGVHGVGDLEGVVWTTPRQVTTVVANLNGLPGIVLAREERTSWSVPPDKA